MDRTKGEVMAVANGRLLNQSVIDQAKKRQAALEKLLLDIDTARTDPAFLAAIRRVRDSTVAIKAAIGQNDAGKPMGEDSDANSGNRGPG